MKEGLNKKHNIEITILSPLNIGAGAEKDMVKGVDFIVRNGKIHILNLKKMLQNGINPDELSAYFITKNHDGLLRKIQGILDRITDVVFDLPVNSTNDIKSFLKNQLTGKPIVAGSSLKGAVRSIILDYLLDGIKPKRLNEKDYFGDSNKGDELMRFIKFTDAEFDKTELVNTKIFNLHANSENWQGGWKHRATDRQQNTYTDTRFKATGFNTIYECLMPNEMGEASIMLSEKAFSHIPSQSMFEKKKNLFNIQQLFNIINEHTYNYISKELDFFKKYNQAENTDKIRSSLIAISNLIPDESDSVDSCVLKMSAGSGFHSITGDWQYDDYTETGTYPTGRNAGKHKYKSRKIAVHNGRFSLMGFVRMTLLK